MPRKKSARLRYFRKPSLPSLTGHLVLLLFFVGVSACGNSEEPPYQPEFSKQPGRTAAEYVLGVHPLHNPQRLHEVFTPIADYLTAIIPGARFRIEASRDYQAYDEKLYARQFHFALPNPYQTINALQHGYRVFGKMGDDENFRGIILVRKDSGISRISDLRGKAVSFPAPTALAATMMPQLFLQQQGLEVMRELDIRYVGSQESSIMSVFLGNTAAGVTWIPPWRALCRERPELDEQLEVKWQTTALPNNSLMARHDIPASLVQQVAEAFFTLHSHPHGQAILHRLELSRFEPADDQTYAPVQEFVQEFTRVVRPLAQ